MNSKSIAKLVLSLFALTAFSAVGTSEAHALACTGNVNWVQVYQDGNVLTSMTSGGNASYSRVIICNVHHDLDGKSPEMCRTWFSMLQAAKLSGRPVTVSASQCTDAGLGNNGMFLFSVMDQLQF